MGPFTPEALGVYKYITKISDEYIKWTEPYLLKSKHDALSSFQVFVQSMVIPNGFRVERLRVDKGGGFIKEFQDDFLQTGVSFEYASIITPQQIGMSERIGRTLAAMVRCMLADGGLPKFLWGELMFTAAFLSNRVPHSAIGMQSPYKMLHGTEPDLRLLRVIGARPFVHIETYSKKLELKAVEKRRVGYSNNRKSYRVYNPVTRCIMESRNVIFIETPSRLFPPPLEETSQQVNPPSNGMDDHNYITDDDFLRDLRDYTSCWNRFPVLLLTTLLWAGSQTIHLWLNPWSGSARSLGRTHWTEELQDHRKKGRCPGESLRTEFRRRLFSNQEQAVSPARASLQTPLAGSQPLQQRGPSRLEATPAGTRAGTAAQSFVRRNALLDANVPLLKRL